MAAFTIRADGLRRVEAQLARLFARVSDLTPLMNVLGRYLVDSTRARFETGIAPDGTHWKPSLRAQTDGGKTLVKSGQLRDSVTHAAAANQVEVGTNKIYAAVHQFGATIRPVNADALVFELPGIGVVHARQVIIPARPYVGVSLADEAGVTRLVERYEAEALAS